MESGLSNDTKISPKTWSLAPYVWVRKHERSPEQMDFPISNDSEVFSVNNFQAQKCLHICPKDIKTYVDNF